MNKQEPDDFELSCIDSFWELRSGRDGGMGKTGIPIEAVYRYFDIYNIPKNEWEYWHGYFRTVDNLYLKYYSEKQQERERRSNNKNPNTTTYNVDEYGEKI